MSPLTIIFIFVTGVALFSLVAIGVLISIMRGNALDGQQRRAELWKKAHSAGQQESLILTSSRP